MIRSSVAAALGRGGTGWGGTRARAKEVRGKGKPSGTRSHSEDRMARSGFNWIAQEWRPNNLDGRIQVSPTTSYPAGRILVCLGESSHLNPSLRDPVTLAS